MSAAPRPISLVAEKAFRYLRGRSGPVPSVLLAREILATRIGDEQAATRVLQAAFDGDPRLCYDVGGWRPTGAARPHAPQAPLQEPDPDRVLITLEGERPARGQPFRLLRVSAVRLQGDDVAAACGGDVAPGPEGERLRRVLRETLHNAVPVCHDPPGSLLALERWLDEPLAAPVSLRRLGQIRLGLAAGHDLPALLARLQLDWRESGDPLESADSLDRCLQSLRASGESLHDLARASAGEAPPIDWSRYDFDRSTLREIPRVPGTYEFYDREDRLLYTGKSRNLQRRVGSYFREGVRRSARVQRLLDRLHRVEIHPSGSELEALLREAEVIREREPSANVQRKIHPRPERASRLDSILILEPAAPPTVLRAYLLRHGRLVGKVGIGPRGGGLNRIERLLEDLFFSAPSGPVPAAGPDVDVETVARWLAANRGRVIAIDPTDLPSAREVTDRLRWFLARGDLFDPDGSPILTR